MQRPPAGRSGRTDATAGRFHRARFMLPSALIVVLSSAVALASACSGNETTAATPTPIPTLSELPTSTPQPSQTPTATSTPTSTPTPEPTPTSTPEPVITPDAAMLEMQLELIRIIDEAPIEGRYAVAVTDLQTGETVGVNEDRLQLTACIANLFVLMLAMQDVENGADIDDVSNLMDITIWGSDAHAARALYKIAGDGDVLDGVERVRDLVDAIGLKQTIIDHPPNYAWDTLNISDDNWTTALDVNQALWDLYHGGILGEPYRTDLLDRLTEVKPGLNYLLAYGTGGLVSHKNGFFQINDGTWVDNDAAIVRFERDGVEYAYAISFFSDFVEEKYGDIPVGQEISQLAWAYFDAKYPE